MRTCSDGLSASAVLLTLALCGGTADAADADGTGANGAGADAGGGEADAASGSAASKGGGDSGKDEAEDQRTFAQKRHDRRVEMVLAVVANVSAKLKEEIAALEKKIAALEKEIAALEKKKDEVEKRNASTQPERDAKKNEKDALAANLGELRTQKTTMEAELPGISSSISTLRTALPYFEGNSGEVTLNALGHARILADWPVLESKLRALSPPALTADERFGIERVGGPALGPFVGALATSITASATSAIEDLLEFSEKAIKKRLEREAVVALVDRLSREFCTDPSTEEFLPHLCALSQDEALNHVASGTAQLQIIRTAAIADLRALPGRSGMAKGLLEDEKLDDARAELMTGLTRGESPMVLFVGLADAVGAYAATLPAAEKADPEQLACRLDLTPHALQFADALGSVPDEVAASAAFIAAGALAERCTGLVLGRATASDSIAKRIAAWKTEHQRLERLAGPWRIARAAAADYAKSAEALTKPESSPGGTSSKPTSSDAPEVQVNVSVEAGGEAKADAKGKEKGEEEKGEEADAKKEPSEAEKARLARAERARAHALVALRFGRAATALTIARARLSKEVSGEPEVPAEVMETLHGLQRRMDLAELVVLEDWSSLLAELIEPLKDEPTETQGLRRLSGMLVALASEDDPKVLLEVVRAAALPVASWRIKQRTGAFTTSLGMQLGLTTAFEVRRGTYGAAYYEGQPAWAAPTLFAPIGLDMAWRGKVNTNGLFFSFVDPAAFLQYDIHRGGRLPGPRITTVFAPGVAFRTSFGNQPFSLMLYAIARPQLRTWEPTVSDPGATAYQFGVAVTWDVPFVVLGARERRRATKPSNSAIQQHVATHHANGGSP